MSYFDVCDTAVGLRSNPNESNLGINSEIQQDFMNKTSHLLQTLKLMHHRRLF